MAFQYENAPINEALIDIRVELPASASLQDLEAMHDLVQEKYPGKMKRAYVEGSFSAGAEVTATARQTLLGFAFKSNDGRQVFQARLDGFTLNRLRPYGNWHELRDECRRLWDIYRVVVRPVKVTRLSVRYINQIDIPFRTIDYKDYFRTTPEVPSDLPQALSGFFMQLQFPQPDFGGTLTLTQTEVPPLSANTCSVILDLDVFKEGADLGSDEEIWGLLETMRNRKNEFFEGSITDKTRELFGHKKEY